MLSAVRRGQTYSDRKYVLIKGDIPILIGRDSADVWCHRDIFCIKNSAGAPPDMYSATGQNWGFPVYDWDKLEEQDYVWWRQRLITAERLYHLYRIDHIVGFYRIWAIPHGKSGRDGHFIPGGEHEWIPHGERIMRMMLESSQILPIGEDLGVVPTEVRDNLASLGICGTKVMRWERKWHGDQSFIDPTEYTSMSMSTVSTHDSETLEEWWEKNPKESKLYSSSHGWEHKENLTPEHRTSLLRACHHSNSLFHINLLQEYLALFPDLISSNPEDERINIPAKISTKNWSYRFKPSVEEIMADTRLGDAIREILRP